MPEPLADALARLARDLTPAAAESLCVALENVSPGTDVNKVGFGAGFPPWVRARLAAFVPTRTAEVTPRELAFALRVARAAVVQVHAAEGRAELVWSGPETGVVGVRRTEQVLRDVISEATHELFLVSFAAFRIEHLLTALRDSARRGVAIHFLLESSAESAGQLGVSAREAFAGDATLARQATFYVWPRELRPLNAAGRPAKLHAKCAVADGRVALLTSANLTADALERNIETGVLIRGGEVPRTLAGVLAKLITTGIVKFDLSSSSG